MCKKQMAIRSIVSIFAVYLSGCGAKTPVETTNEETGDSKESDEAELSQDDMPDDYLLFVLTPSGDKWEGGCVALEGFTVSIDVPASLLKSDADLEKLKVRIKAQKTSGQVLYPNGKITPVEYEILKHRGKEDIYMKSSLGYFIWERAQVRENRLLFAIYFWYTPPVRQADLKILEQAESLLRDPNHWHREDDRKCEGDEESNNWSLFCALKYASIQNDGEYNHHNTAIQTVRFVIDELVPEHGFEHTLMDYNNAPSTTHEDILRCLDLAKEKIKKALK